MPNWCDNTVYFSVDPKSNDELGQIVDAVQKGKNKFSLDAVIPMPAVLKEVSTGSAPTTDGRRTDLWWKDDNDPFPDKGVVPVPQFMREEWIEDYGADNSYDWAVENWDTKWDTDPKQIRVKASRLEGHRPTQITYSFQTAWGPPFSVYKKLKNVSICRHKMVCLYRRRT